MRLGHWPRLERPPTSRLPSTGHRLTNRSEARQSGLRGRRGGRVVDPIQKSPVDFGLSLQSGAENGWRSALPIRLLPFAHEAGAFDGERVLAEVGRQSQVCGVEPDLVLLGLSERDRPLHPVIEPLGIASRREQAHELRGAHVASPALAAGESLTTLDVSEGDGAGFGLRVRLATNAAGRCCRRPTSDNPLGFARPVSQRETTTCDRPIRPASSDCRSPAAFLAARIRSGEGTVTVLDAMITSTVPSTHAPSQTQFAGLVVATSLCANGSRVDTDTDTARAVAFGDAIRRAREAKHWTQEELGIAAGGLRANYVSRIERGRAVPSRPTRLRLAEVLGISPSVLDAAPLPRASVQQHTGPDHYPNRAHAVAVFREEATDHGADPLHVERTVRQVTSMVLSPDADCPIRDWIAQLRTTMRVVSAEATGGRTDVAHKSPEFRQTLTKR